MNKSWLSTSTNKDLEGKINKHFLGVKSRILREWVQSNTPIAGQEYYKMSCMAASIQKALQELQHQKKKKQK